MESTVVPSETTAQTPTTDSMKPNMSATECATGQMPDGNDGCSACPSGFYKSQSGNENCAKCLTNTDTNGQTGSISCSKLNDTQLSLQV